jgi:hypothetical protein
MGKYSVFWFMGTMLLAIGILLLDNTHKDDVSLLICELNEVRTINDSLVDELNTLKNNEFSKVHNRFKVYNENIDSSTTRKFMEVIEYFNLDTTNSIQDACISQICLESGAKQYFKNGKLVVSSGNAVGISQITPTTAHHYLKKVLSLKEREEFAKLGASDFSFVDDNKRFTRDCRKKIIEWLSNIDNNIILWGYIMKHTLIVQKYNMTRALIEYKDGRGGLNGYIKEGNSISRHSYIVSIKGILKKFTKKGV